MVLTEIRIYEGLKPLEKNLFNKLTKWVKIAYSFLQSVSNQFYVNIKNFSKPTSRNGDIGHFNL